MPRTIQCIVHGITYILMDGLFKGCMTAEARYTLPCGLTLNALQIEVSDQNHNWRKWDMTYLLDMYLRITSNLFYQITLYRCLISTRVVAVTGQNDISIHPLVLNKKKHGFDCFYAHN